MQPASIISFVRFFLGALVADALAVVLGFPATLAALSKPPASMSAGTLIFMLGVYAAVALALWYFAARRRSVVAKWILSIWFVVASCLLALSLYQGEFFGLVVYLNWIAYGLRAKATSELFKPDADTWFSRFQQG